MNNFENLFSVIKSFLPIADKYLVNSPLEPYLPQIQNIVSTIDSLGGIDKINALLKPILNPTQNITNNVEINNNSATTNNIAINNAITFNKNKTPIDYYKKIDA